MARTTSAPRVRSSAITKVAWYGALSCPRSLNETYAYPTWAVVIDADNDGRCSHGDKQVTSQLYGWNSDVGVDVTLAANGEPTIWPAVAEAHTAVGDRSKFDFCSLYFR
jgi:hypothetical protein